MILIDNNILSTFARVSAMDLLFTLFLRQRLGLTPAIRSEVLDAIERGCAWLRDIVRLIESGRLQLVALTPEELAATSTLPDSLGDGVQGRTSNEVSERRLSRQEPTHAFGLAHRVPYRNQANGFGNQGWFRYALRFATGYSTDALSALEGDGERECIAVCQGRGWPFLTNDKRARNYCQQTGVEVYDLAGLLRALWERESKCFVRQLTDRMEAAEGMVIKNKEAYTST